MTCRLEGSICVEELWHGMKAWVLRCEVQGIGFLYFPASVFLDDFRIASPEAGAHLAHNLLHCRFSEQYQIKILRSAAAIMHLRRTKPADF